VPDSSAPPPHSPSRPAASVRSSAPLLRPAVGLLLALTLLTGIVYPLAVTLIVRVLFPFQASGSLIVRDGRTVGSTLIGQSFTDPGHFWGRPSATTPQPYNGVGSSGSNFGPLNPALTDAVRARLAALRAADPGNDSPVPVDLVTASASGLDPHISRAAADYQVARIARVRGVPPARLRALIATHAEGRLWGVIGEPRVNVLELNLALDTLK
jgi:potassium-transporting ATPase KdpC subunit